MEHMKPLFLTYSNGKEPYVTLANKLGEEISNLDAGDFYHLEIKGPGNNVDFFAEANGLLYSYISKAINFQPVIVLDCDNGLKRPIDHLFNKDWDIAAAFRFAQIKEWGRQDYCSGLVALNNRRPAVIKKFWIEWTYKTAFWKQSNVKEFPQVLRDDGWLISWYTDQSSLNQIILPEGNQDIPEKDSYEIIPGQIYETHGYKILPLERRIYGAKPIDSEDACVIHYKGKGKKKRLEDIECKT